MDKPTCESPIFQASGSRKQLAYQQKVKTFGSRNNFMWLLERNAK